MMIQLQLFHKIKLTGQSNTGGSFDSKRSLEVAHLFGKLFPPNILNLPGILSTRVALYLIASNGPDEACSREQCMTYIIDCIQLALQWYESLCNEVSFFSVFKFNSVMFL